MSLRTQANASYRARRRAPTMKYSGIILNQIAKMTKDIDVNIFKRKGTIDTHTHACTHTRTHTHTNIHTLTRTLADDKS